MILQLHLNRVLNYASRLVCSLSQNRDTVYFNDASLWVWIHFSFWTEKELNQTVSMSEGIAALYVVKFDIHLVVYELCLLLPAADRCKEVQQIREQHPNKIPVSCCSNLISTHHTSLLFHTAQCRHQWSVGPVKGLFVHWNVNLHFECDVPAVTEVKRKNRVKLETGYESMTV